MEHEPAAHALENPVETEIAIARMGKSLFMRRYYCPLGISLNFLESEPTLRMESVNVSVNPLSSWRSLLKESEYDSRIEEAFVDA